MGKTTFRDVERLDVTPMEAETIAEYRPTGDYSDGIDYPPGCNEYQRRQIREGRESLARMQSSQRQPEQPPTGEYSRGYGLDRHTDIDTSAIVEVSKLATDKQLLKFDASDVGNAESVMLLHGDKILYNDTHGWLHYNGKYWEQDQGAVKQCVISTLKRRRMAAIEAMRHEDIVNAAKTDAYRINGCMSILGSYCQEDISKFDNDPDMLNCANGVLHLPTGTPITHSHLQRFTYCLDTEYHEDADCSEWEKFLHETVEGGDEAVNFLQEWVGYCLTGSIREEKMLYVQGATRSGKGTFAETLQELMTFPLSEAVNFGAFTARRDGNNQNFDLAPLKAARAIFASESDKNDKLNGATIKGLTGGDRIPCSFKGKDVFSYRPMYKITAFSNWDANFDADDSAVVGRLVTLKFPYSHIDHEDMTLKERFKQPAFLEGVLAWAVIGAMRWYERGRLAVPEVATKTRAEWRNNQDVVGRWLDECCTDDSEDHWSLGDITMEWVSVARVRESYTQWCKLNGHTPKLGPNFNTALVRRGIVVNATKRDCGTPTKVHCGINRASVPMTIPTH